MGCRVHGPRYFADFAFIGVGTISTEPALLDFSRNASELRSMMLDSAKTRVVVADHSKFGSHASHRVAGFEKITHIITDLVPEEKFIPF